ncbi:hypothetical protein JIQ42_08119 [Leishmania sp. Namibia]|uniref:hypothetical protein n=1 Tax=Leishmania sp. Namibia TaxID=2802991 RepID=UPI001B6C32A5|nr:hypothetical protein JIQ42_08119 [Leishmania sp. Namibia]
MEVNNRHMNPLAFDDGGGCSRPQQHGSIEQNGTCCGSAAGNGAHTAGPLPEQLSSLSSGTEVEGTHAMPQRSPQPRTGGFRSAARGFIPTSGGDDDPLDVYTSSASSSTTSPQWHRHNPYRALSTTTSTPAHSPGVGDSGSPLTLPSSLVGVSTIDCATASQHLNVALHLHASRGNRGVVSGSEASKRPQQAPPHLSGYALHACLGSKTSQTRPALSRTSSAASCTSSHYSCSDRRNSSSTGFLPDVDVVEGSTASSGVFLMHNYQFRLNTCGRSGAASSSATTPHSYTTADRFFEETGGFTVDDDDGIGSDSRRRFTASRSSPYEMDHRQGSVDADDGYGDAGTAPLSLDPTARSHAPGPVSLLLSSLGRCASASLSDINARGRGPLRSACGCDTAATDTSSEQSEASAGQGSQRLTRPPSIASLTETRHEPQQAWPSGEPNDSDGVPAMPSYADPTVTPADYPEVEQYSHAYHLQPPPPHLSPQSPCSSPTAPPHATSTAAAPSFTGVQLTELLEAHLARARGGSGGGCGGGGGDAESDEVWCPAGSQFSVYDSAMREHYRIESERVAITRGAIKYASLNERYGNQTRFRFQLCNRYLHRRCFSAAECQYIHSLVVSTATQVHMNENSVTTSAVRQMNREELAGGRKTLDYPTMAPGMIFAVYPPNQLNSSPQLILSELILMTEGAVQTYQALSRDAPGGATHGTEATIVRPRHCAHFQFKRMCNLGTSCHFIHSLIPFVQGMVNQPPLPPGVDLNILNTNAAGVVLPSAALGAGSTAGKEVDRRVGGAQVADMTVRSPMHGQAILPVWPTVAEAAQEAMLPPPPSSLVFGSAAAIAKHDRPNAVYGRESSGTQIAQWTMPQDASAAAMCAAVASPYQVMAPIASTEIMDRPAAMLLPPYEMQNAAPRGFDNKIKAVKRLFVPQQHQAQPQPLLVGMPSMLAQRPQSQQLLPTHHHSQQRWSSSAAAPLTSAAMPLRGHPSEARMRRGHTHDTD